MEQKLESLTALVTSNAQAGTTPSEKNELPLVSTSVIQSLEMTTSFPLKQSITPQIEHPSRTSKIFHPFSNYPFPLPTTAPFSILNDIEDVISRGIITIENAEESVQHFRTTASNAPFVIISPDTPLDYLRRQKPFLLLTILAANVRDNINVQKLLDEEVREKLSRKVFVSGEKSMDLLQGILVYLTW
jgi:hypothetical protein